MKEKREPKLFDIIALLKPVEEEALKAGDVGTVVEILPPDAVEVEFLHRDGRTRCLATVPVSDLLVLNRERMAV